MALVDEYEIAGDLRDAAVHREKVDASRTLEHDGFSDFYRIREGGGGHHEDTVFHAAQGLVSSCRIGLIVLHGFS